MLRTFLEEPSASQCTSLRHVICSGEALTYDLQEKFFERLPCELQNLYGPTEAAVDVTHWTCRRDGGPPVVPIGRPVSNTQIHILDDHLTPVPVGAEGELHIGGAQVGRGYHNRPHLTAERFVPDPFSSEPGAKLYKTGDLARWMPDGNIEYLGRLDFQVKIRGFRIELGEIESVLAQHSNVRQAVVNVLEDSKDGKQLVAYLLPRGCRHASVSELHRFLLTKLPDYMVPSLFMWLDAIPLSPNGKVDRRALPVPTHTRPQLSQSYAVPSTDLERCIVALWRETLRIDQVGIDDRFFELGGNSLGLARIHVRLQETLGREFPISTLFEFITVRSLAAHFESPREAPSATKSSQDRARLQRKAFFARRPSHRQL
jgi:acyl-coenzyme A synthetase/AMP-(fatty) acid ligase/acyl carrier protein